MRPALFVLALWVLAPPAAAQENESIPSAADMHGQLAACLDASQDRAGDEACIGSQSGPCMDVESNQTTMGMMTCEMNEAEAWELMLNALWKPLRAQAKEADEAGDAQAMGLPGQAETLLAAQRVWLAFREAECAWEYAQYGSGSMRQLAGAGCRLGLTARRVVDFRDWMREG